MCGIAGILRRDGHAIPDEWLDAIDTRIAHRGPDGQGVFRDRLDADAERPPIDLAFIHRRMSIIDLEDGTQPMVSQHGRTEEEGVVAVTFNGCIYNHRALRRELESHGHRFRTDHSDTEVLIHGYREWGSDLADHLEGMYAFAIWDRVRRSLMISRDWFGRKPLYVRHVVDDGLDVLAFCSDARALAQLADRYLPDVDGPGVQAWCGSYLQLGYNWKGSSIYRSADAVDQVTQLPPTVTDLAKGWLAKKPAGGPPEHADEIDARIEKLLDDAVARRLEADVPLGCFLSGGVDSSLIAACAVRHVPDLRTFAVRMPDERYDESAHAQIAADHLGTKHTTLDVEMNPAEDLVHLIRLFGQPFGDSSILPTYWVSKAARKHVKVALSGDGGDELFLGYERYMAARHLVRHRRVLRWLPGGLGRRAHPKSKRHKMGRLGAMARDLPRLGVLAMESLFTQSQIRDLLKDARLSAPEQSWGWDPMQSLREIDLRSYLPDDLMTKVDTASMAVALEVRCPFLDRELAQAAMEMPTYQLAPRGQRKGLLRRIARRLLPAEIVDRPKMGFAIPVSEWFRDDHGDMRTLLEDQLGSPEPFGDLPVDAAVARRFMTEHIDGGIDHGQRLFALLTLSLWSHLR